ncbi:TPA: phosphoadenosine phosphosulfate reductase family protein, partial [Escherichia coli]|nr:phosphoadenosine phosphosulfate reductase family protein [Escherichia coli]HDX3205890.1 phosphoadenosine phosphosulfate reductase family protein [Escherichia coli]
MFIEKSDSFLELSSEVIFPEAANAAILKHDKWADVWETLTTDADLNYTDEKETVSLSSLVMSATSAIYQAITDGWTMCVGYSGGKDSHSLLHLFLMALIRAVRNGTNISEHHFIQMSDTLIENPEMHYQASQVLNQLRMFIAEHQLPVTVLVARPSLTQSWVGRILTGRGLPTWTNSATRQCTTDLKIAPLRKAKALFLKNAPASVQKRVCLMLGSRDDESARRAGNILKMGGQASKVTLTEHGGELYPVKEWRTQDIWSFLMACGSESRFPLPSFMPDNFSLATLYKDATGECIWSPEKSTRTSACGARYGCSLCTAVLVNHSMEALIHADPEKYGYQAGLSRLQRFLSKIQYDWSLRDYIGRKVFEGGYVRLQPNIFSSSLTERLFHVCCSLDYVEARRAAENRRKLLSGEVDDTAYNRRMAEPQFRLVQEANVIHVDFLWSLHCFNPRPFRAIEIYRRVWEEADLDLLEDEPDMQPVPRTPMPAPLWLKLPGGRFGTAYDGLTDTLPLMTYFDGQADPRASRSLKTVESSSVVVAFEEEDELTVEEDTASWIIWHEYDGLRQRIADGEFTPTTAAQYLLRYGAVRISKGKGAVYHRLAQRGQTFSRLGIGDRVSLPELVASRRFKILSDSAYRQVVARKLRGQIKKFRFCACVAACVQLHVHNKTALGERI